MGVINAPASGIGVPGLTTTLVITSTLTTLVSGTRCRNQTPAKHLRQVSEVTAIVVGWPSWAGRRIGMPLITSCLLDSQRRCCFSDRPSSPHVAGRWAVFAVTCVTYSPDFAQR